MIKRDIYTRLIYECRCDERLKAKAVGFTRLTYTGLRGELEYLKIETRLIDERLTSVMGECDLDSTGVSSIFQIIRNAAALARMLPTFDADFRSV